MFSSTPGLYPQEINCNSLQLLKLGQPDMSPDVDKYASGGRRGWTALKNHSPKIYNTLCIYMQWYYLVFFFWSVPWPGIQSGPLAVKVWSPNHWTTREFPQVSNYTEHNSLLLMIQKNFQILIRLLLMSITPRCKRCLRKSMTYDIPRNMLICKKILSLTFYLLSFS